MKLITIDDLLLKAKENEKAEKIRIEVSELGGVLEFEKLNRGTYLDLMFGANTDRDAEIIYTCCPMLHDDKLITSLECKDNPVEVVGKLLSGKAIFKLATLILEESGYTPKVGENIVAVVKDDIKN